MDTKHVSRGAAQPLNFEPRAGADHARADGRHQITSPQQLPLQVSMARTAAATPGTSVAQRGPVVVAPRDKFALGRQEAEIYKLVKLGLPRTQYMEFRNSGYSQDAQGIAAFNAKQTPAQARQLPAQHANSQLGPQPLQENRMPRDAVPGPQHEAGNKPLPSKEVISVPHSKDVVAPRKKGFDPTQVQQFVDSGGDKKSALQYARTGATPTQTMALHQAKISPNEAIEFEKLGITPQEVLHWSKTSVNLASPVASTLRQQGYTDIQIRGFVSLGCKPELTARYHGMGATPLEAIAYQRVGLSPENAAEFKKLGFSAPQALRWNTSRNGLELAQTFRQSFTPQQSFAFYRQGFSPEQAKFVGPLEE